MKERYRSRNARRRARPGRGPLPVFMPGPSYQSTYRRHAELCHLQEIGGLTPAEVSELIDLRIASGRSVAARNAFGEVL